MADRLSALDASFLYLETSRTPLHVGSVIIVEPGPGGLTFAQVRALVAERLALVPRFRQRLRTVPASLGTPVWVDDERFDLDHHVFHLALPAPGDRAALDELVARVQARRLDRTRPLWEVYVVEGLQDGRVALLVKVHQVLVDGVHAIDLTQVMLDVEPDRRPGPPQRWLPSPEPTDVELVVSAVADTVRRPAQLVDTLSGGLGDLRSTAEQAVAALGRVAVAGRLITRPTPSSPLNREPGRRRRFASVDADLEPFRRVRDRVNATLPGGPDGTEPSVSVTDVVLTVIAGGLRSWLQAQGRPVASGDLLRALVPVSVSADGPAMGAPDDAGLLQRLSAALRPPTSPLLPGSALGDGPAPGEPVPGRIARLLIDLPVGEPDPRMRLLQVAWQSSEHRETGRGVEAGRLASLAGFAPPTLHLLGLRMAGQLSTRQYNLMVLNVPGPQTPLYLAGARMVAAYPVIPLSAGQGLSVGVTSYDGRVYLGLNADRDALPDLDVLAQSLREALAELLESAA